MTTTGLRLAFEPSQGPAAPALRTGFGMVLSAVVLLVGATVFSGSVTHLLESKHLIGWNWDALLYVEDFDLEQPPTDERLRQVLAATPGVVEVTPGTIFPPLLVLLGPEQRYTQLYAFGTGPIRPTLISGRAPSGPGEVVLGRETLSRLGRREGDRIPFVAQMGESDDPVPAGDNEFRGEVLVVGTAVVPAGGGDNRLGTGGALDLEFYRALVPGTQAGAAFVRVEPDADLDDVVVAADGLGVDAVGSLTQEALGHDLLLRDVEQVRNLPIALAAMLALLAVGVVVQIISGSVHARRGELGILRALGFRPSQIRQALVVQAVAVSGSVLIIGLPLGIAIGRAAWGAFAFSLGTKPEVSLAARWLGALVVGLVVLASLLGLIGSARPRRQLVAALRRE